MLQEISDCFAELIKPLATNEMMQHLFDKLGDDIVQKFEEKFSKLEGKINKL